MNAQTYYEVLGLATTCTAQEIKRSYHQLALIWHPDKHTDREGANLQFMFINEAYNILSDIDKRNIYDVSGKEGLLKDEESKTDIQKNIFSKKGFQGTEKSAVDILKEIIEEKVNEDFLKSCEASGYSRSIHSSLKSFVHETVVSSDEDTANFLADYQPTFLNAKFAEQSQYLDQFLLNNKEIPSVRITPNPFNIKRQIPRARKNSFLATEGNKKNPFKVLKVVKTKSDALLIQTLKNSKRVFLINDEDEQTEEDDEFLMSFVQPKFIKRQNYCSEAIEDSDNICPHLLEKISKKLKTETVV
jgi:curved DNA-binding protein CbpA